MMITSWVSNKLRTILLPICVLFLVFDCAFIHNRSAKTTNVILKNRDFENIGSVNEINASTGLHGSEGPHHAQEGLGGKEMKKDSTIEGCPCSRLPPLAVQQGHPQRESTCSEYSTWRGEGQKVFSYSYYQPGVFKDDSEKSSHFQKYLQLMQEKLNVIQKNFPGWIVRLYHNLTAEEKIANDFLCDLYCKYDFLDPCKVTHLPGIGNLLLKQPIGRLWRFAVIGDPTVEIFFSRDTDSSILEREIEVIKEWFDSEKRFHLMRDHPHHKAPILAGLWGGRNGEDLVLLRNAMLFAPANYERNYDQFLLRDIVWPRIKDNVLQHVSYTCEMSEYGASVPFPSKRVNGYYVGWGPFKKKERRSLKAKQCPYKCRPRDGKSWLFC